jgi:hypothetical protein
MRKPLVSLLALLVLASPAWSAPEYNGDAYPGAVGWGRGANGWRGGQVIKVTNLNDSGAGSLRACAELDSPRVCMFETGGTIEVTSSIQVEGNVYIAGQSAPADSGGIQVILDAEDNTASSPIYIFEADDVVLRHFASRPGPGLTSTPDVDAVLIQDSQRVIIDHMSLFYSTDELINTDADERSVFDITISWNLMAFALHAANHPDGNHSKSALLCSARASLVNAGGTCGRHTFAFNVLAHNNDRNPDVSMIGEPFEIINNVIYNPAAEYMEFHDVARTTSFSVINNLGIDGSNTSTTPDPFLIRVADDPRVLSSLVP